MNINGIEYCPRCNVPLMEKTPKDNKQINKVIRYYCMCGFYKDVPVDEIKNKT